MWNDVRYGWRRLTQAPGFAALAIGTLALGIGATTTVFSLANAFLWRPLPIADPARAIRVYRHTNDNSSYPDYEDYRDRNGTLAGLAAYQVTTVSLRDGSAPPTYVFGEIVTSNYFDVLGVKPTIGRFFRDADGTRPGTPTVVVLGHRLWQQTFGGDRGVIGRQVRLNGVVCTVIGVAPRDYLSGLPPYRAELFVPMLLDPALRPGSARLTDRAGALMNSVHIIGRLRSGVTLAQARADLGAIARQLELAYPKSHANRTVSVYAARPLHDALDGYFQAFIGLLLGVAGAVLLTACFNVANLLLARAKMRGHEISVRRALGAGRARIVRQMLAESLILAVIAGAAGTGLAVAATQALMAIPLPTPLPITLDLGLDGRVLAWTVVTSMMTTLVFGLAPALHAMRADVLSTLKLGQAPLGGSARTRLASAFMALQLALSLVLLIGAGLFARGLTRAGSLDPGFQTDRVLMLSFDLTGRGYDAARARAFTQRLAERVSALPGVVSAGLTDVVPLRLWSSSATILREGEVPPEGAARRRLEPVGVTAIGPGYLETLGIPIVAGRAFTVDDTAAREAAAIINETMARRVCPGFPGVNPIGQRLREWRANERSALLEIVGVAKDAKYATVGESPRAMVYRAFQQGAASGGSLLVRTQDDSLGVVPAIRAEVAQLDADVPLFDIDRLGTAASISLLPARVAGLLLAILGTIAAGLAAIGLYGVTSYLVKRRTREIGVRLALGASRSAVIRDVVSRAMRWTAAGLTIGLALAVLTTRFATSFLYGLSPTDPITFVTVPMLLCVVSLLSAWLPAHRASRIDPLIALRHT